MNLYGKLMEYLPTIQIQYIKLGKLKSTFLVFDRKPSFYKCYRIVQKLDFLKK